MKKSLLAIALVSGLSLSTNSNAISTPKFMKDIAAGYMKNKVITMPVTAVAVVALGYVAWQEFGPKKTS